MKKEHYLGRIQYKHDVRLLLLNPVTPTDNNDGPFRLETQNYLLNTTQVDDVYCTGAPRSITFNSDVEKAVPFVLDRAKWAESEGYDVVIINCMLDPGLQEAKTSVSIPVIGLREAAQSVALMLGRKPGFIYPDNIPVLELAADEEKTYLGLVKAGRSQVAYHGADVLIPNCGYLGGLAQRLQSELGVPVLANTDIAVKLAELIAMFQLKPEMGWVNEGRSETKLLLTKLYKTPFLGSFIHRSAKRFKKWL